MDFKLMVERLSFIVKPLPHHVQCCPHLPSSHQASARLLISGLPRMLNPLIQWHVHFSLDVRQHFLALIKTTED